MKKNSEVDLLAQGPYMYTVSVLGELKPVGPTLPILQTQRPICYRGVSLDRVNPEVEVYIPGREEVYIAQFPVLLAKLLRHTMNIH